MEELYHQTNSLIQQCQHDVATCHSSLVSLASQSADHDTDPSHALSVAMETIISNCRRLDVLADKEPMSRRHNAKLRVDQLKHDCRHLQTAIHGVCHRRQMWRQQQQQREQLLAHRFTSNSERHSDGDTCHVAIDAALCDNDRLQSSHNSMDNLLAVGAASLASLRDQRQMLRGARARLMGVASTLGLSNTVMRLIERRAVTDRYLLFGGMLVTVLLMYLMWLYLAG